MKKRTLFLTLAMMVALALPGCSSIEGSEEPVSAVEVIAEPIRTEEPATEPEESPAEETNEETFDEGLPIITERYVRDGKMQSYLTGEWIDAGIAMRRPMAVMIPNNKAALPQYGISLASVIYEAPMEAGSCTRLMGVFENYDELEYIGPVRSSRLYFIHEAMPLNAIYCNWGLAVQYVADTINSDRIDNISAAVKGIDSPSDEAFTRSAARQAAGYATEYTGIMTINGYNAAVERHGYDTQRSESDQAPFDIVNEGVVADYPNKPDATVIRPGGTKTNGGGYGAALPSFVYNPETGLYTRHQFGGVMKDEYNGEEIEVTNVILKLVNGSYLDSHGYFQFDCSGIGSAYMFTHGKVLLGWWTKDEADDAPTKYFYEGGEELVLNPGKTWVCLVWKDFEDQISYE